jgi:PIN domain nuclease of toxin-antitoxin system
MRLLLDTHVFLWALEGRLSAKVRRHIEAANEVFVSSASIWEIAIKARLGKIDADPVLVAAEIEPCGFRPLAITHEHAARVYALPEPLGSHKDPFDRLLLAQSLCEPLLFLTADKALTNYGAQIQLIDAL